MEQWSHFPVLAWTAADIAKAVDNAEWQRFRLSMKGVPTPVKLDMLRDYYVRNGGEIDWEVACRVHNYLKALSRGGLLTPGDYKCRR